MRLLVHAEHGWADRLLLPPVLCSLTRGKLEDFDFEGGFLGRSLFAGFEGTADTNAIELAVDPP